MAMAPPLNATSVGLSEVYGQHSLGIDLVHRDTQLLDTVHELRSESLVNLYRLGQ